MDPVEAAAAARTQGVDNEASIGAARQQALDYDSFLRLLVEQMKNQDPLEPMSESEYVAQLATFSNVEQNIITNDRLLSLITATTLTDAQSLIGRTVTTATGEGGVVANVKIASGEMLATLTDGSVITIGDGITVA
mgnify:CR=1 FL=1